MSPSVIEQEPTTLPPEASRGESIERFGRTLISPEDIQHLKGKVTETLNSEEPDKIYKTVDQLSALKRGGLRVGVSDKLQSKLQTERENLKNDPHKLAKYLVRLNYLGVLRPEEITTDEKALVATRLEQLVQDPEATNLADFCVNAKGVGVEIPPAAKVHILKEIATLSRNPADNNADRYVKRLAQARYLGVETHINEASLQQLTEQRLVNHQEQGDWTRFARLQSLYTRATDKGLPLTDSTQHSLVEHAATLKEDPLTIGHYSGDLRVIEQSLPQKSQRVQEVEKSQSAETVNSVTESLPDGHDEVKFEFDAENQPIGNLIPGEEERVEESAKTIESPPAPLEVLADPSLANAETMEPSLAATQEEENKSSETHRVDETSSPESSILGTFSPDDYQRSLENMEEGQFFEEIIHQVVDPDQLEEEAFSRDQVSIPMPYEQLELFTKTFDLMTHLQDLLRKNPKGFAAPEFKTMIRGVEDYLEKNDEYDARDDAKRDQREEQVSVGMAQALLKNHMLLREFKYRYSDWKNSQPY